MTTAVSTRPAPGEYAPYYARYVDRIPEGDLAATLEQQGEEVATLLGSLSEDQGNFRYAEGKWCIKEVISHVTDAERVFSYRALRFSRGDQTELPGFDENSWTPNSGAAGRTLRDMSDEFVAVRRATIAFMRSLTEEQVERSGVASGNPVTVRGLLYIIAGHAAHHVAVLRERYLTQD
jgi:hypothetical protein